MLAPTGEVLAELYDEMHRLASSFLRNERPNHTLQPSALINEAYIRMVTYRTHTATDRPHFLRLAARAMRQVLIDHARGRNSLKRSGLLPPEDDPGAPLPMEDYLTLSTAIDKMEAIDPQLAAIVELRFFAGLSIPETAGAMEISEASVKREWVVARAWLRTELGLADEG